MKLKVLCVDDSRSVHAFLKQCLGSNIEEFHSALDGTLAVEFFKQNPGKQLDVIFLDWEMPKMTGPETFRELRKMNVGTTVIMLTSKNDPQNIAEMLDAGVAEYIMKPFTPDIIMEKLQAVLPS
jgi:two-component system chemotaxis response regulator CheY